MVESIHATKRQALGDGLVIPACPLALNSQRRLDEQAQRRLIRYYMHAGAGGLAVGVHTTQFAIREPQHGLLEPILELAAEELRAAEQWRVPPVRIAGVCGPTRQAMHEAELARQHGYDAVLLSLAALADASQQGLLDHCQAIADVAPLIGFYLQPAVGGRELSYSFWCRFAEIENVVAIKIAPFNRYQTLDVVRAVVDVEREDIALYTGNDDSIVVDLLTPFTFRRNGATTTRRIVGGLLGQWAVWTHSAVQLLRHCHRIIHGDTHGRNIGDTHTWGSKQAETQVQAILRLATAWTDANAAFFDAANGYQGCIAGLHEVLRRQRLLDGIWCLDPSESLSPGQADEITRVYEAYPELNDDEFVEDFLTRS